MHIFLVGGGWVDVGVFFCMLSTSARREKAHLKDQTLEHKPGKFSDNDAHYSFKTELSVSMTTDTKHLPAVA